MITMSATRAGSIDRFKQAQDESWPRIAREIATGRKKTHWMWYVFPQLKALAKSETAQYYGIADQAEALAYLDDPVLRIRLYESTRAILGHRKLMFDATDARKLRSCMTLFSQVVNDATLPQAVLDRYYDGRPDQLTLDVLAGKKIPEQWTRRAVVGRHWDKQIRAAQGAVAATGRRAQREYQRELNRYANPMTRREIEAFVRGFGLSAAATRQVVEMWSDDQDHAREAGYESARDSYLYDN